MLGLHRSLGRLLSLERYFQSQDAQLIRRIFAENAPRHWRWYSLAIVMAAAAAVCTSGIAYLIGQVVNSTHVTRSFSAVATLSVVLVVLFAVKGMTAYGSVVTVARAGNRITAETQHRIFEKLLGEGLSYFANRHSSEFMANSVIGAPAIARTLNTLVLAVGRDLLTLIGLVVVMVWQDPLLCLIALLVMPIAMFGVQKLQARARRVAGTQFTDSAAMLSTLQETLQGLRIVKAFNLEAMARARVDANIARIERASNRMARISNRSTPLFEALGGIAIGLSVLYCGYRVLLTNAAPGEFVAFMTAFLLAFDPAKRLARIKVELSGDLVAVRGLFFLIDSPSTEPDDAGKPALRFEAGAIELSDVNFSYGGGPPVLRDLSLVAAPHHVTALVGLSGSGKSTIFNLLLRYYDAERGSISIDGQNVAEVSRHSLRASIAYVGQDVFLFRGSIRENIMMGRPQATEVDMTTAAKAAFAHDFIMNFPQGYDTPVGKSGTQLSLGQRQRVALARALVKNAPIVLLDEATASLDSESEHYVQMAIRRLCAGKTTLVIAHRLNTILDANQIHVIDNGAVVESGTHAELLRRGGRYANFCRLQFPRELAAS